MTVVRRHEKTYALHTDHLGSTQRITDEAGNVVWRADYSPFGRLRNDPPDFDCPLFHGPDVGCGERLVLLRGPPLRPRDRAFITPDPWTGGPDDVRLVGGMGSQPVLPQIVAFAATAGQPLPVLPEQPGDLPRPRGLGVLGTIGKTILAIIWSSPWTLLGATLTLLHDEKTVKRHRSITSLSWCPSCCRG